MLFRKITTATSTTTAATMTKKKYRKYLRIEYLVYHNSLAHTVCVPYSIVALLCSPSLTYSALICPQTANVAKMRNNSMYLWCMANNRIVRKIIFISHITMKKKWDRNKMKNKKYIFYAHPINNKAKRKKSVCAANGATYTYDIHIHVQCS